MILSEFLEPRVLMSTYDAAKDFSTTANPSGPWSYGVRFSEFADFAPFPVVSPLDFSPSVTGWSENSGSPPYVGINTTKAEVDSQGVDLPTGVLAMHPGGNGEYADVRFTVPEGGMLNISYNFKGIDTNGTTTDVHVLFNGQSEDAGADIINGFGQEQGQIIERANTFAGDTVDFLVGEGTNKNFFNDCTSLSAQISTNFIANHLTFTRQPPSGGDLNSPVIVQVKEEDPDNKVVKSAADGVLLSLNTPAGTSAAITNTAFVPFKNGVATFTAANAPVINGTGTFTLTATAGQFVHLSNGDTLVLDDVSEAISDPFQISPPHVVFLQQPKNAEVNQPIPFTAEVLNSKNKPAFDTAIATGDTFEFSVHDATFPEDFGETSVPITSSKYNNLKPPSGSTPITERTSGSYFVGFTVFAPDGTGSASIAQNIISQTFQILPSHIDFTRQPQTSAVNTPLNFQIALRNFHSRPGTISPVANDSLFFTLTQISGTGLFVKTPQSFVMSGTAATEPFSTGVFNNRASGLDEPLAITAPGTYRLTVEVIDNTFTVLPDYEAVLSKVFTIKA